MSKFLESIACENCEFPLLKFHQQRVNRTFANFYPSQNPIQLKEVLPKFHESGRFKFRVLYDGSGAAVEFAEYTTRQIQSVRLVESSLDYSFKFSDRTELNALVESSDADEIIICKNGLITDSSYANIACFDGLVWWTPRVPLLEGIKRSQLLETGIIQLCDISLDKLRSFQKVCLINAMLDLGEIELDLGAIQNFP